MSSTELSAHQKCGQIFTDGALLVNEAANLLTETDRTYCSCETLRSARVRERVEGCDRHMEITGSPDMVLKVVSSSSVRRDAVVLLKLYTRADIRKFWRIDTRGDGVNFEILRQGPSGFESVTADREGFVESPTFDTTILSNPARDSVVRFMHTL